jgi:hypothetical protein
MAALIAQPRLEKFLATLSIVFYVASLFLPAFRFSSTDPFFKLAADDFNAGIVILLLGWMETIGPGVAWLANPAWILSHVLRRRGRLDKALACSIVAVCLSLSSFFVRELTMNEGGGTAQIYSPGLGFYVWFLALTALAASLVVSRSRMIPNKSLERTRER